MKTAWLLVIPVDRHLLPPPPFLLESASEVLASYIKPNVLAACQVPKKFCNNYSNELCVLTKEKEQACQLISKPRFLSPPHPHTPLPCAPCQENLCLKSLVCTISSKGQGWEASESFGSGLKAIDDGRQELKGIAGRLWIKTSGNVKIWAERGKGSISYWNHRFCLHVILFSR